MNDIKLYKTLIQKQILYCNGILLLMLTNSGRKQLEYIYHILKKYSFFFLFTKHHIKWDAHKFLA